MAIAAIALLAAAGTVLSRGPFDARVAIQQARSLVEGGTSATDSQVQSLARRALSRDLTQPEALELKALAYEGAGDRPGAARLYRLSDRISRRSLATRLWLVQDAVARADVPGTLANMELALRTSSVAPKFVFPALATGISDPSLVGPIAAMVDRPSDWRERFLVYIASNADPSSAAALFLALKDKQVVSHDELDLNLAGRLVEKGQFSLARQVDLAFDPRPANGELVEDGHFGDRVSRYPFGWGLAEKGELGASRENEDGRSFLSYHANPAEGGQAAAQLLTLRSGAYELETKVGSAGATKTPPTWSLICGQDQHVFATLELPTQPNSQSRVRFSIPPQCQAQWLVLTISPALSQQSGSVENVSIVELPVGQAAAQ